MYQTDNHITFETFQKVWPLNWEEMADAMNRIIDERGIANDYDACHALFSDALEGKVEEVPDANWDYYDATDYELVQAVKNTPYWDWDCGDASACKALCDRAFIDESDYTDEDGNVDGEAMLKAAAEALGYTFDDLL